jgi:hypothetical protein
MTACTRCTWLAKQATMTRPTEVRTTSSMTGAISRSEVTKPGCSALVESPQQQVDALAPEPGEAAQVGQPPVHRQLVHLEVAGVQDDPGLRLDRDREGVGDGVVDGEELQAERAVRLDLLLPDRPQDGLDPVLAQLGLEQGEGEGAADDRDVGALAQQVGHGAEVVLVAVREHDGLDVVEPVPDVREVRQDQVDAGLLDLREQHAAVDDEQPPGVLEDRHVAADLAQAAERDDAQRAVRECRWCAELRVRVAHAALPGTPALRRSSCSTESCSSVAGTSGSRTGPPGRPRIRARPCRAWGCWCGTGPRTAASARGAPTERSPRHLRRRHRPSGACARPRCAWRRSPRRQRRSTSSGG